jgi:hypothetical protein
MDALEQSKALRKHESTAARTAEATMSVDPGLVHHRLIQNLIGAGAMQSVNEALAHIAPDAPEFIRSLQTDHVYVEAVVILCSHLGVPPLTQLLAEEKGRLFASVETTLPCPEVYDGGRVSVEIQPKLATDKKILLEFEASRVTSDTTRMEIANGSDVAIIGQVRRIDAAEGVVILEPMVVGGPSLESASPDLPRAQAMWLGHSFGEVFAEDITEFAAITNEPMPKTIEPMQEITERAFKQCLAELLGQEAEKDWGGEQSDLYSAHLHLNGQRVTGAFLLKGPASFRPMRLNHLGANNDQIVRLAHEPADLLVVQHSHEIGTDVRATLRAFANGLGTLKRRYCLIDGADSLRLLKAYDKLTNAQALSVTEKAARARSRKKS